MKRFTGFERGMGLGGWLTNYKRFHVIPENRRMHVTVGDMEHFAEYITEKDIEYIASLGMDHVRLGFDQIVLEKAPYEYREEILNILDNFVSWCHKHGLNIVFNLHKAIGNYCDIEEEVGLLDDKELQNRFVALWLTLEQRYSNDSTIAFELLNEVVDVDPQKWNNLAERTLKALRQKNATRKIIIGCTCWNAPYKLPLLRLYDDENVIYTFHTYEPFEFTHQQGVLQDRQIYYNRKMPYPCDIERYRDYRRVACGVENAYSWLDKMDSKYLCKALSPAIEFTRAHPDKILWCGEFGTIRHAKLEWRENWMRDMIALLKQYDIPYCVWNYLSTPNDGNRFSLVDDDSRKILSDEMARIIRGEI
jgi:hypothetical protein